MLPLSLQNLASNFRLFPGVGLRSSQKMALDALQMKEEDFNQFVLSLHQAKEKVKFCDNCGFFADIDEQANQDDSNHNEIKELLCQICQNPRRNKDQICLVEKATDVLVMEKSESFNGNYFVLQKLVSPLDRVFPEDTQIANFINKYLPKVVAQLSSNNTQGEGQFESYQPTFPKNLDSTNNKANSSKIELILFFKAGFSADATTMFLRESLQSSPQLSGVVRISRLAQGLPLYFNPDTLDKATMVKALEDRRDLGRV